MHELSIATALMDQIRDVVRQNQLKRVESVELEVGFLRQVIDEVMQSAFAEVTAGTVADGAVLTLIEIAPQARCRQCQREFVPKIDNFLCPSCQLADVEVLAGEDIVLKLIKGE